MKDSTVYAKHIGARMSPKKVSPVADLIRGKGLKDAKIILTFEPTKASETILKVLKSAEANAKSGKKLDVEKLFVSEVWVSPGPMLKNRGRFVAKGRFSPTLKRTSHIYVGLKEKTWDKK